ncbi:MAG: hypothetical protein ACLFPJ_03305 [Candidatus Woesearchaeota archaeon]
MILKHNKIMIFAIFLFILIIFANLIIIVINSINSTNEIIIKDSKGINNNIQVFNEKVTSNIPLEIINRGNEKLNLKIKLECLNFKNCNDDLIKLEKNKISINSNMLMVVNLNIKLSEIKKNQKSKYNVSLIKENNELYDYLILDIKFG